MIIGLVVRSSFGFDCDMFHFFGKRIITVTDYVASVIHFLLVDDQVYMSVCLVS